VTEEDSTAYYRGWGSCPENAYVYLIVHERRWEEGSATAMRERAAVGEEKGRQRNIILMVYEGNCLPNLQAYKSYTTDCLN